MENTYGAVEARAAAERVKNDATERAEYVKSIAAGELKNLIADVEDLLARTAHLKEADVVRIRGKVEHAISAAKSGITDGADTLNKRVRQAVSSTSGYVRESPWQAVGIAALIGAAAGLLASRRS